MNKPIQTRTFDYKIKGYHVIPAHKMVPNTSSDQVETIVINIRVVHKIYRATKALGQSANKHFLDALYLEQFHIGVIPYRWVDVSETKHT